MLLADNVDCHIVGILAFWYSSQKAHVRWHNTISEQFTIGNGTRQGGILSPALFNRYVRDVLLNLRNTSYGCNVAGLLINVLAYADDFVLLAPTWRSLQQLINVLADSIEEINMTCNVNKTVCMIFYPDNCTKSLHTSVPSFKFANEELKFVTSFKYLGHFISDDISDDLDIEREIRNLFVRTNIVKCKFNHCSLEVKVRLFNSYCICLYGSALWRRFKTTTMNRLRSAYHKCIKVFFGFRKCDSVTDILMLLGLPSFSTLLHNNMAALHRATNNSSNLIVKTLNLLCLLN